MYFIPESDDDLEFEYDPAKSQANLTKHGINFEDAKRLWDDPDALEFPRVTFAEPRWIVIGRLDGRCWTAVITVRGDVIRIISVRRSRQKEVALYESRGV